MLGVMLGLLLMFGLFASLWWQRGGAIDGEDKLQELFGDAELPWGLELVEALQRPSGEEVLRLRRPEALEPEAVLPEEVVIVTFPSAAPVNELFGRSARSGRGGDDDSDQAEVSQRMADWREDPSFDWHTLVDAGEINWRAWRADYLVERSFKEGGGWRDSAWVNLSQPGRNMVLFAIWGLEIEADKDELRRFLTSIQLLEIEDA